MKNVREEILKRIDIVEIVSSYVDLEKKGQNYNCLCPFHDDNNPSLVVSPEKQIFKCFVCETGGTAIDFVSKFEKIPYSKALSKLGKKVGIKTKSTNNKNKYNEVLEDVNFYYTKTLTKSDFGIEALKYLKEERELNDEIIEKFQLGFSPKFSEALYNFLNEKIKENKYSAVELDSLNIFNERNYDILNNRITFPILDEMSNIVGYSGRTLDKNSNIKYLNSKESTIFHKNKILYNLNNVIESKSEQILLVEGFFDVITAYKYGINYAVASMGTAFGVEHIELLKKNKIKKVYLGFDSDSAGQKALYRSAKLLIKNQIEVNVVSYGEYKDIDECLNSKKYDAKVLIENSKDFLIYLAKNNIENISMENKIKLIETIKENLVYYKNDVKKNFIIEELVDILKINKDILLINDISQPKTIEGDIKKENKIIQEDKEKIIVYIASINYQKFLEIEEEIKNVNFIFKNYQEEYDFIKKMYVNNKEIDIITLLDELPRYIEIEETAKIYGEKNLIEILNIKNYFDEEKKNKVKKLKKLF